PQADGSTSPGGDSVSAVTVDANGKMRAVGTLADGSKLSQAVPVSKHGQWPFYVLLYGGKGAALGWLHFTNASDSDLSGLVTWIKLPQAPGRLYTDGFVNETIGLGSRYVRAQSATNSLLASTSGTLAFRRGD